MRRVHGKGLSGFIFGLLCATAAIAGVLYFLNHSSSGLRQAQEQKPAEPPPVEMLQPKGAGAPLPDASSPMAPPVIVVPPAASEPKNSGRDPASNDDMIASEPKNPPKIEEPKPIPRPRPEPEPRKPADDVQPSPEDILNQGNVEKAREHAARQNQNQRARQNQSERSNRASSRHEGCDASQHSPEEILNNACGKGMERRQQQRQRAPANEGAAARPAQSQNTARASGGRNSVQVGVFSDKAGAEAVRSRMNSMGVRVQVQETNHNGQRVYRVRSGNMSAEQAQALAGDLRARGVDAIVK